MAVIKGAHTHNLLLLALRVVQCRFVLAFLLYVATCVPIEIVQFTPMRFDTEIMQLLET